MLIFLLRFPRNAAPKKDIDIEFAGDLSYFSEQLIQNHTDKDGSTSDEVEYCTFVVDEMKSYISTSTQRNPILFRCQVTQKDIFAMVNNKFTPLQKIIK